MVSTKEDYRVTNLITNVVLDKHFTGEYRLNVFTCDQMGRALINISYFKDKEEANKALRYVQKKIKNGEI